MRAKEFFAGFDVGGTQIKYGVTDGDGRLVFKGRKASPESADELFSLVDDLWTDMKTQCPGRIAACGFGLAGFFSSREQIILQSPNYPLLDSLNFVSPLKKIFGVPFWIDNDANMAAYGEWARRFRGEKDSLVFLTLGTGLGSGIILAGRLWQGRNGFAGELGHLIVNPEGERCNCGARGCLETEVSASRIAANYRYYARSEESLTSRDVHLRARRGDPAALKSFERCAHYLGIGLGGVISLFDPGCIVLGGGVMAAGRFLLRPTIEETRRRTNPFAFARCSIERSVLGNDAGILGASAWARDRRSGKYG